MTLLQLDYVMSEEKLVFDVIDNGGQWTHREWRMLRYLGVDTQIFSNKTPLSELRKVDGLILSGGAARVGLTGELGNCAEYLTLKVPILGICAGHQFMAGYYGGKSQEAPHHMRELRPIIHRHQRPMIRFLTPPAL